MPNVTSVCLIIAAVIGLLRWCLSFIDCCHWFVWALSLVFAAPGYLLLRTSLACHGEVYRNLKVALSVREQYVQLLGQCSVLNFFSEKQSENTLASVSMLRPF